MDFKFTEEELLFKKSVEEVAEKLIAPGYMKRQEKEEYSREILKIYADNGLLGFGIPEEYGGQGVDLSNVMVGLVHETLARADMGAAFLWQGAYTTVKTIEDGAPENIKREWLPQLCAGDAHVSGGITEPQAGTDLNNLQATAVLDGDEWVINCTKTSASFADAELYTVYCRYELDGIKTRGNFIVPRSAKGVSMSVYKDFGLKCVGRGDLHLDNVRIPFENLIRSKQPLPLIGRACWGLMAIGTAEGLLDRSVAYTKQRQVFNWPLAKFEAISFGFVEHYAKLEAARLLGYKALSCADEGNSKEAEKYGNMIKFLGGEYAIDAIWFGTRALGNLGYTSEYDALYRLADALSVAWADGAWEAVKIALIKPLIGKEFVPYVR